MARWSYATETKRTIYRSPLGSESSHPTFIIATTTDVRSDSLVTPQAALEHHLPYASIRALLTVLGGGNWIEMIG